MQNTHGTYFGTRKSGISLIGDLPWGSHFCQFYQTPEDLREILVPYLRAGLENNEFCVWVVDSPAEVEEAREVLRNAVPRFQECVRKGQMEILPRDQWRPGAEEPGSAVVSRLDKAISSGFDGVRLACNALPEEIRGRDALNAADTLCEYHVIAAFACLRDKFDAIGLMDVVKNHRLVLVKNADKWELLESSEARTVKDAVKRSEEKLRSVFANMSEGFAYHRIVLDARGNPCDYVFLEVNEAFERLTGLKGEDVIGRRATEALPGMEKDPTDWIGTYGAVALHGRPVQFESFSPLLGKWYSISAFSPHKGFFAVTFSDITDRKAAEEAMRDANDRLQSQAEELQTQAEELQTQAEELNAQAEELRTANEELQTSEEALRTSERRVRTKLDSILSPDGDLGTLELPDIIDSQAIQSLVEDFYRLARIPLSIVDLKGRVLVGVGWQDICTKFHRVHPETCRHCIESDTQLSAGIPPGQCRLYKCKNHMWDIATPLLVAGKHVGHLFSGQFFFEDEPVDRELFRSQARRYGFDEQEYLAALDAVPRLSRESVDAGMSFFMQLARMISQLSYSNIQLARSLEERRVLLESLREGRERLSRAQEIAHLGSWELDLVSNELTWSDEVYRIFGLEPQEFAATYEGFLEAVHPDDRAAVNAAYSGSLREGKLSYEIEHRVVRKATGEVRWVHEKCQHATDAAGRVVRSIGMVLDVTGRKHQEQRLRRLNRMLQALGNSSQALMHATEETAYMKEVCRIIIRDGGHAMVWIGLAEQDEDKTVRPVASAGFEEGYLDTLRVTWADTERGRGPTGMAIRTGRPQICRNMLTDPAFLPWRQQASERGYASSVSLPLLEGGKAFGALTIYAPEPDAFPDEDIRLLTELAGDLAFGITSLRLRAAKARANEALRESEAQLQAVVENLDEGVVVADLQGRLLHWNRAALAMHGFATPEECRRRLDELSEVFELSTTDGALLPLEQWPLARILSGETLHDWEVRVRRLDNDRQRVFNYSGTLVRNAQDQPFMAIVTVGDITERKQAEEAVWSVALFPEQNPSPVLRVARDGTLLYANGPSVGLLECWGCGPGEAVPDRIRQCVERAMGADEVMEVEALCGSIVYSFAVAPIGSEGYANLYGRDVTEHKRAAAHREHHLDLHVKLVQITRDILDVADLPVVLQKVADAALDLTGARLGSSGHGFVNGRPQVRAVSRGADVPPCQMQGGFSMEKGGVHLALLHEQESIRLTDEQLRAHPAWWGLPEGHMPLRGLLGARLLGADGRPNGMIMVSDKSEGDFTEEDEVILRQLATITSLAIRLIEARDEAQQRAAEAIAAGTALQDSAERLRLALEGGRMGRWEWDLQADESFWDPRMYELLGAEASKAATSQLLLALADRQDRDTLQGLLRRAAADGGDFQTEFRVCRPDGETVWLTLCGKVILDESGRGARMFSVVYDVTQRKQMEAQLRRLNDELEEEVQAQTEELRDTVDRLQDEMTRRVGVEGKLRKNSQMLEGFFRHTITPLAFMDRDFNFVRVNAAYAAADKKAPAYFIGRNHFALYPHDETRAIFERVVQTRQPYRAHASPFNYPDASRRGVTFWNWQLTPLLGERDEVQFLVLNLEDVTERQRAFQEVEKRARQLQHLTLELSQAEDRERRRLAEILHDDLQQQLAAAKFHLGILGGRVKRDESVQSMVGQLNQILSDAIEKSRSLSHELSPAVLYHSDLGETFEWLAQQVQTKHGLTVHVDAVEQVHLSSEPLKAFLYRSAQEILFNIVKHARVREARLRLKHMRGRLWLTIADQGQGFDPLTLEKSGGFGLFSIRERIELLGGRMKVRSVKGRGSIFVIVMPDGDAPGRPDIPTGSIVAGTADRPADSAGFPAASGRRLRVLLADDHKVMREGLASLLSEQADMDVVGQAGNGREAVNLACTLEPDVVIMDIAMPLMTGDEATRQIKLHLPKTRVIALSMFEEVGVAEMVCKAGAEGYLLKTAPFDELLAAIRGQAS